MNPVKALQHHGQSIWLDFLARGFAYNGKLNNLLDVDGICDVASNPGYFQKGYLRFRRISWRSRADAPKRGQLRY